MMKVGMNPYVTKAKCWTSTLQSKPQAMSDVLKKWSSSEIDEPVSLSSGRSAMVPVLTTEVPIELFSMFDLSQGRAMASLVGQIENKTSTPLVPGPATIYRDGNFVGDAALPRIEMGQKSEVVFGFDPAVSISVQSLPQKSTTRSAKLNGNDVVVNVEIARSVSYTCLLYTSPSPRDQRGSRMPSSA